MQQIDEQRREMARDGNHSRSELDARRRDTSTQAWAVAAGRQAMQTDPQTLTERRGGHRNPFAAVDIGPSTGHDDLEDRAGQMAAYRRLNDNGFNSRHQRTTQYRALNLSDYQHRATDYHDPPDEDGEDSDFQGLDARDTGRPEPKADEELVVQMECKVCYSQLAEVACLPCGHLVMCRWCSEQHSPCMAHDHTRPRMAAQCPVCRKGIRQKVKVFRA